MNDRIVETFTHRRLAGKVAIGAIQDLADSALPQILARFTQAHPDVQIIAKIDRSKVLAQSVDKGELDLAIGVRGWSNSAHRKIRTDEMVWLSHADFVLSETKPVPLVVFEPPCGFRDAAINSLNAAGRAWELCSPVPVFQV